MQTILESLITTISSVIGCGVGAVIGLLLYNEVKCNNLRKNVLKAIKDLNIEDELSKCPFGVNAKLFSAIKTYLWEHDLPDPFVGQGSALAMTWIIADLRRKNKIKPLEPVNPLEPVKENSNETSFEFSISAFNRWLAKWGFKKNLNMLQLMQYRLDEYQGDLGLLLRDSVFTRISAKEYLVTLNGEYVFVDASTLSKMEADFYAENVSRNNHLIAIPKDWVDDTVTKHPELMLTDVE